MLLSEQDDLLGIAFSIRFRVDGKELFVLFSKILEKL